jgi:hypothetical protein
MLKFLSRRVLMGLLAAGAVVGTVTTGALVFRPGIVLANTSRDYDDAQTFMVQWNMRRIGVAAIACAGICRVATSDQSHGYPCAVSVTPTATTAACLTALAAACTTSCAAPPP